MEIHVQTTGVITVTSILSEFGHIDCINHRRAEEQAISQMFKSSLAN